MLRNILKYQTSTGLLIPDTSNVRDDVISAMKDVFGIEFKYIAETPNGLFVDLLTTLIKDFAGITAQNVNGLNPKTANGAWLDALAELFGFERKEGESDGALRRRILQAYAVGPGFVPSVYNAIYHDVPTAGDVCVLENGKGETLVVPNAEIGVALEPHSILVVANSDDAEAVGKAIDRSMSAGCGFSSPDSHGTEKTYTSATRTVKYYVPEERFVKVTMKVNPAAYVGTDISSDTASAIRSAVEGKTICAVVKKSDFEYSVAAAGKAIVPVDTSIFVRDDENNGWTKVDALRVMPYQFVTPSAIVVEVTSE